MASDTGNITDTYDYTAFGDLYPVQPASLATPYLYTGQRFDSVTEQYYLRARYYNPGAGHFLSRDIWPADFNNPITLNRYAYVSDNPINLFDPSGHTALISRAHISITNAVSTVVMSAFRSQFRKGAISGLLGFTIGYSLVKIMTEKLTFKDDFMTVDFLFPASVNAIWGGFSNVLFSKIKGPSDPMDEFFGRDPIKPAWHYLVDATELFTSVMTTNTIVSFFENASLDKEARLEITGDVITSFMVASLGACPGVGIPILMVIDTVVGNLTSKFNRWIDADIITAAAYSGAFNALAGGLDYEADPTKN